MFALTMVKFNPHLMGGSTHLTHIAHPNSEEMGYPTKGSSLPQYRVLWAAKERENKGGSQILAGTLCSAEWAYPMIHNAKQFFDLTQIIMNKYRFSGKGARNPF